MIRKLLIVAASAFVLSVVSITLAWVIGGKEFVEAVSADKFVVEVDDQELGPRSTREFALDPAARLVINVPADVSWVRGEKPSLKVEGPDKLMALVEWKGNRLVFREGNHKTRGGLTVTITAPRVPDLEMGSAANIDLEGVNQDALTVDLSGAANLSATGRVRTLTVDASGAGNLDLQALDATDAKIDLSGFGNADLNVGGTLDAAISGAGNVTLHRKPRVLRTEISGIGNVDHAY